MSEYNKKYNRECDFMVCDQVIPKPYEAQAELNESELNEVLQKINKTLAELYQEKLHLVFALRENILERIKKITDYETQKKYLDIIKICDIESRECTSELIEEGLRSGDLDIIKYIYSIDCLELNDEIMAKAAINGHLNIVEWLRENSCPWDELTCSQAAEGGHVHVLKYLHENKCPWDADASTEAAKGGHLDILKYLHENGCPWDSYTCASAADEGHLDILKYLHENGCPWDLSTTQFSAQKGYNEILRYAYENGCEIDTYVITYMAKNMNIKICE